ncbi:protein THYLAKOID FORMATION1, chloroplastic-like [Cucurbita pepo subsp. pepo]|uniref:Protein THYLAKOID FORMATION1, chloroplastic-like n=1 Tax=Cucurbita moschata TaxID=3662 RepID=A0A6J1ES50_CUCMO|nr:protein THYLAKOID FORMATION1, chloroplastic-like [Cucurbita moschata]XP_023531402.1 protein THYLAKOID FORMATION1, chloroplastic-like [Cucurbita pepo subsp. pepo]
MAAVNSVSFSTVSQFSDRRSPVPSARSLASNFDGFRFRSSVFYHHSGVRTSSFSSRLVIHCMSAGTDVTTVAETKLNFLKAYKRPIPSIYNSVLQELIVQQHLMRYKRTYRYDPVFALGFVTVYDQLMDGYPSDEDREAIFQAYIKALNEDPEQYRIDAQKLEEWARSQSAASLVEFASKEGEVESVLKDIAERAASKGSFSYSRFFAIGLFRLLELANATEPSILEKLCAALNVDKKSVDRDLDVYRNLLSKLVQAKELLKEYVDREKKKRDERAGSQTANEAVTK